MKKILIPVIAILAAFIAVVIYAVSLNYNMVQYDKDLISHMMSLKDGDLIAEYNGQTTHVIGSNINRVQKVIGVSEKQRLNKIPEYDENNTVILEFPDGAEYIIAEDINTDDGVFILYTYNNKHQYFSVNGYNSFDWTTRAVSPEGINTENEVIE